MGVLPIHSLTSIYGVPILCQALCWHKPGRKQLHSLPSRARRRLLQYPRTKNGQGETSKFTKSQSQEHTLMDGRLSQFLRRAGERSPKMVTRRPLPLLPPPGNRQLKRCLFPSPQDSSSSASFTLSGTTKSKDAKQTLSCSFSMSSE